MKRFIAEADRAQITLLPESLDDYIDAVSRPEQLADSLAAAERGPLPSDLKVRLDEITHGWRAVDAAR